MFRFAILYLAVYAQVLYNNGCRSEGDIAMKASSYYDVNTTKPNEQDQVYEECDIEAYEELYN